MPRSSPLPSPSAASPPASEPAGEPRAAHRRKFRHRLAAAIRWLHIYLSMFGLASVLFFGATGITLNHPDWAFGGAESTTRAEGEVDPRWLGLGDDRPVLKLEVVESLRARHQIRGALAEFRVDDRECLVSFKGPGYSADAFIERPGGRYQLTESRHGFLAVINDLHKGRDTGAAWSVVIDASAALMVVISLTGLALLFYIKRRRVAGLGIGLAGTAALGALYWFLVP